MIDPARTIKRHWQGVLRWFTSQIDNGILKGISRLVQAAKARAHGYRSSCNLIPMIDLLAGKLRFDLPSQNSEEPLMCRIESMLQIIIINR